MIRHRSSHPTPRRVTDEGSALPLVLVLTVSLSLVVLAIASYVTTNLKYAQVTADRSDRLSAADAGMRYAIDQLKLRNAACIIDTVEAQLPRAEVDFNGANATITCQRISGSAEAIQAWAAVMTGVGVAPGQHLISTQGGNSQPKVLGGPVYMSRVTPQSFDLGPVLEIENGSLYYFDGGACTTAVSKTQLPASLVFSPDLIYGPICTKQPWTQLFKSPLVPAYVSTASFPERFGHLPISEPGGSYEIQGNCRVFHPGRYTTPPDLNAQDAYFLSGDYVFDLPDGNATIDIRQGTVTAGRINPVTTPANAAEIPPIGDCAVAQAADPGASPSLGQGDPNGATWYLAGRTTIQILNQGSLEIHGRRQGNSFVSVQALCSPSAHPAWCESGATRPDGTPLVSTLTAPAGTPTSNIAYTSSGNNRELVAHGIVYAPLAQMEFGNVSNNAVQKLLGGLVLSRLVLQSSASAMNFEIAVPTSPITAEILLTSTATKNGATSIRSVVEYRPYEGEIADRIRVNSWRVCETSTCS